MEAAFKEMGRELGEMLQASNYISKQVEDIIVKKEEVQGAIECLTGEAQDIAIIIKEVATSITEQQNAFEAVNENTAELSELSSNLNEVVGHFEIE